MPGMRSFVRWPLTLRESTASKDEKKFHLNYICVFIQRLKYIMGFLM